MSKEAVAFYFKKTQPGEFLCICGIKRKQKKHSGYSNLYNHITGAHPQWRPGILQGQATLTGVTQSGKNLFSWIKWITDCNFVDEHCTRAYTNLNPICRQTLVNKVDKLVEKVEQNISSKLPEKFGIIVDGWSVESEHYIAVFASYQENGVAKHPLLAFSPLIEEESLNAASHLQFIEFTLSAYKKSLNSLIFICCDNENTNKALADLLKIPMIGCASHRLNLAVKFYLQNAEIIVNKVCEVMKKLKTIKKATELRCNTKLTAIVRNKTRWSSTYDMLCRYLQIKPFINREDNELKELFLTANEEVVLDQMMSELKDLDSVTKKLQAESTTMSDARSLFDAVIRKFPALAKYLQFDSKIVHSKEFERAVVKAQRGEPLTDVDQQYIQHFKNFVEVEEDEEPDVSFADTVLSSSWKRAKSGYSCDWVPAASNLCERSFSVAKNIKSPQRNRLAYALRSPYVSKRKRLFLE